VYYYVHYYVQNYNIVSRLTQSSLAKYPASSSPEAAGSHVVVENWTKWRLYLETDDDEADSSQVGNVWQKASF
jgi:hypothetical protein